MCKDTDTDLVKLLEWIERELERGRKTNSYTEADEYRSQGREDALDEVRDTIHSLQKGTL